jgi:Multicopper oxidase
MIFLFLHAYSDIEPKGSAFSFSFVRVFFPEYTVDGKPELLRWAVNNISMILGNEPLIGKATETARLLGWPAQINGTVDVPLTPPLVWNYTQNVSDPGGPGKPLGTLSEPVIQLMEGEVFELVLQNARALNGAAEFHPWHAHGYSFWVVGQGQGIYDPETDVNNYNLVNPVLRDTVSLEPLGWVALRFVADNPGTWLFHCHILSHHIMGMGFVMVVEPNALGDISASVASCTDQQLDPSSGTTINGTTNGTSGAKYLASGAWIIPFLAILLVQL